MFVSNQLFYVGNNRNVYLKILPVSDWEAYFPKQEKIILTNDLPHNKENELFLSRPHEEIDQMNHQLNQEIYQSDSDFWGSLEEINQENLQFNKTINLTTIQEEINQLDPKINKIIAKPYQNKKNSNKTRNQKISVNTIDKLKKKGGGEGMKMSSLFIYSYRSAKQESTSQEMSQINQDHKK